MTTKPTLEEQIAVSKMTEEECIRALMPKGFRQKCDFWLHCHFLFLWQLIHWNWFDPLGG